MKSASGKMRTGGKREKVLGKGGSDELGKNNGEPFLLICDLQRG